MFKITYSPDIVHWFLLHGTNNRNVNHSNWNFVYFLSLSIEKNNLRQLRLKKKKEKKKQKKRPSNLQSIILAAMYEDFSFYAMKTETV